jgi:hypothetical protein
MFSLKKYHLTYPVFILFLLFVLAGTGRSALLSEIPVPVETFKSACFNQILNPCFSEIQVSLGASSKIKLERKHRKIIESTPELFTPQVSGCITFQANEQSCLFASSSPSFELSGFLIRGPPRFC